MTRPALLLALAVAVWATLIEPRRLVTRRVEVRPHGWPAELDGLRIACVADLHTGAPHVGIERLGRVLERLNGLGADLIALLGDYVDPEVAFGRHVAPAAVAGEAAVLSAPLGVFAVLGNHDWVHAGLRVPRALAAEGITVLENQARPAGEHLWVVGLADASTRFPDLERAFAAVPDGAPVLVLSHDPDLFPRLPERATLTLAGHTHGGQVNLPGIRARATPSRYGTRYARGVKREGDRTLFVTSGVGTSRLPVRFLRPPEIVVLTVRAA